MYVYIRLCYMLYVLYVVFVHMPQLNIATAAVGVVVFRAPATWYEAAQGARKSAAQA